MILVGAFAMQLLSVFSVFEASAKIGYFWHITDLHWDTNYNYHTHNCWYVGSRRTIGRFGDHNCDSPWSLIESAANFMHNKHGDNIEFILWTGDGLAHTNTNSASQLLSHKLKSLQNVTHLLSHLFSSQFVFPVLGHDDPGRYLGDTSPYRHLEQLWRQWLPSEALTTFNKGGYYTIEQKLKRLRLILLNTNLWTGDEAGGDPGGQWRWLEDILSKSLKLNETVYLVGHMAPGADERQGSPPRPAMSNEHNARYLHLVKTYASIITGQFFGHLHSDTFRIVYNDLGKPVSSIFLAPSVTPKRTSSGINNPGLRLYKIDIDTGQILDYTQYYLDLQAANQKGIAQWEVEYTFAGYYGISQVSSLMLHQLKESFIMDHGINMFNRYYQANGVQTDRHMTNARANTHYCAITHVDMAYYRNCLATAASALAASSGNTPSLHTVVVVTVYSVLYYTS